MSFSNYLENKGRHGVWRNANTVGTLYVGRDTSDPGEGNTGTESLWWPMLGSLSRFTVTANQASNTAAVEFPTASASWGTVTYAAIFYAVSGGNMMAYGALTTSKTIAEAVTFSVFLRATSTSIWTK